MCRKTSGQFSTKRFLKSRSTPYVKCSIPTNENILSFQIIVNIHSSSEPANVISLAHRLRIPTSPMFMCPGPRFSHSIADLGTHSTKTPGSIPLPAKFNLIGVDTVRVGQILAGNGMATGLIPQFPYRPYLSTDTNSIF